MNDWILVFESWLIIATEYIVIDNTSLRLVIHVDVLITPSSRTNNNNNNNMNNNNNNMNNKRSSRTF